MAAGQMLIALDFHLGPVQEFAVVGDPPPQRQRQVLRTIRGRFRPNKVVALQVGRADPGRADSAAGGKTAWRSTTTYICEISPVRRRWSGRRLSTATCR